jgi:PIN domain nuclease of toxin-antitoxin system
LKKRYLLDTHIWLWAQLDPQRLSPRVLDALNDEEAELYLSPLSVWEAISLACKNRVDLGIDPVEWTEKAIQAAPIRPAAMTFEIGRATGALARPPRDPVDRFLVATAGVLGLCLVTADEEILAVAECPLLSNRV